MYLRWRITAIVLLRFCCGDGSDSHTSQLFWTCQDIKTGISVLLKLLPCAQTQIWSISWHAMEKHGNHELNHMSHRYGWYKMQSQKSQIQFSLPMTVPLPIPIHYTGSSDIFLLIQRQRISDRLLQILLSLTHNYS